MDREAGDLLEFQTITIGDVLKESINIPKYCPKTFGLISAILILPLSFAILAHSYFFIPLFDFVPMSHTPSTRNIIIIPFVYPVFVFVFSLLSTAAVVFTVASLYTGRQVSFISTLSSIPRVFNRLFITFLFVFFLYLLNNIVFVVCFLGLLRIIFSFNFHTNFSKPILCFSLLYVVFLPAYVYITALWHLASVVSVVEPVYGLAAVRKSKALLKGKTRMAVAFVLVYLVLCLGIEFAFGFVMYDFWKEGRGWLIMSLVGGLLVAAEVILNCLGLLVQSVFYYVCKKYHNEEIDRRALHCHLDAYLEGYERLNKSSSIEMQSSDIN